MFPGIDDGLATLRDLRTKLSKLDEHDPLDPERWREKGIGEMIIVAIGIAIRDTRDQIRELEIRRSRGLSTAHLSTDPLLSAEGGAEGAADERG